MNRGLLLCVSGLVMGSATTYAYMTNSGQPFKHPLVVKLHRYEMQDGSEQAYKGWIKWHDDDHASIITALEEERMYFEAVFRDPEKKRNVLYWVEVHGEGGASVSSSPEAADSVHMKYLKQILVPGSKKTADAEYLLVPDFIEKAIRHHQGE